MAKSEIANMVLQTLNQTLDGVSIGAITRYITIIDQMIRLKEAGIAIDAVMLQEIIVRVKYAVEGVISSQKDASISGGIAYTIANLGGSYGSNKKEAARLKIDMETMTAGAPDFEKIKEFSVPELKELMNVANETLARIPSYEAPVVNG